MAGMHGSARARGNSTTATPINGTSFHDQPTVTRSAGVVTMPAARSRGAVERDRQSPDEQRGERCAAEEMHEVRRDGAVVSQEAKGEEIRGFAAEGKPGMGDQRERFDSASDDPLHRNGEVIGQLVEAVSRKLRAEERDDRCRHERRRAEPIASVQRIPIRGTPNDRIEDGVQRQGKRDRAHDDRRRREQAREKEQCSVEWQSDQKVRGVRTVEPRREVGTAGRRDGESPARCRWLRAPRRARRASADQGAASGAQRRQCGDEIQLSAGAPRRTAAEQIVDVSCTRSSSLTPSSSA